MVKKVIMNVDSSKASGPDCIPVVVLKNCEPELSYILAELYNIFLIRKCNAIYRIKCDMDNKNSQSIKCELSFL